MPLRVRTTVVDLHTKKYQKLLYKQFDNNIDMNLKIIDNGVNVDLAPYTIVAFFDNGVDVIQKNTAKAGNIVTVQLDNNILAYKGFVKAEFNFLEGQAPNQKVVTSFTMLIEVEESINRNEAVTKQPQWDILTSFQTTLDEAVKKANDDVQIAITKLPKWTHATTTGQPTTQGNNGDYHLASDGQIFKSTGAAWQNTGVNIKGVKGDQGNVGPAGPRGATGPQGQAGANAGFGTPTATVDNTVGTPSVTVTASGPNTAKVFEFNFQNLKGETGATGPAGARGPAGIAGPTGPKGDEGTTWQIGTQDPNTTNVVGRPDDLYLNTTTGTVYKQTNARWEAQPGTLRGPQGPAGAGGGAGTGPQGPPGPPGPIGPVGPAGTPGASWFFGTAVPTGATGTTQGARNGDYYLDTDNNDGNNIYKYNGTAWTPVARSYTHPTTHPSSMITLAVPNDGKNLEQFFEQGGTIGGATTVTGLLTANGNVATNRLQGSTNSGGADSIYVGGDTRNARISTGAGGVALWTTPHSDTKNSGIHVTDNGRLNIYSAGAIKHFFESNGNATIGAQLSTGGQIVASSGNIIASAGSIIGRAGVTANTGNIQATAGEVIAGTNVKAGATLVGNRIQGNTVDTNQTADRFQVGTGTCRIDTTGGLFRFMTSALGVNDNGLRIYQDGRVEIVSNNQIKHQFSADGSKIGGTMEIDGTIYGMSPTDSPQTLIEYIEYDVNVNGEKVIKLDNIYSKMISKYAVFSSNPKIEIIKKEATQFTVKGIGVADFVIKGQRKGSHEYFEIMGGIDHGTTEEQTN